MKRLFATRTRRIAAVGLSAAVLAGAAGAAFAFFTATGSGSGTGAVGSPTAWAVNNPTPGGSAYLYPGAGSQTFAFTVTNNDGGNQGLNQVVATVAPDAAAATAGCQASWYDVSINGQAATATTQTYTYSSVDDVPSGGVVDVPVVLTMPDANTNQNACEGDDPVVTLSAS